MVHFRIPPISQINPITQTILVLMMVGIGGCSKEWTALNPFAQPEDRPTPIATAPVVSSSSEPTTPSSSIAFRFSQSGEGIFTQGQTNRRLTAVLVEGDQATVALVLQTQDGAVVRLRGNLVSRTPDSMTLNLAEAEQADAAGTLRIQYGENQAIEAIVGDGLINRQVFSLEFAGQGIRSASASPTPTPSVLPTPTPSAVPRIAPSPSPQPQSSASPSTSVTRPDINLSDQGGGLFQLAGRDDRPLSSASVIGHRDGSVDLSFRFLDGGQMRFGGSVERMDAYTIEVRLTHSGNASADGIIAIDYGDNYGINTVFGDGTLDAQPFSVQFRSEATEQRQSAVLQPIVLTCHGSLDNLNYAATYRSDQGFSTIQFRDRNDRVVAETNLTYSQQNQQGQAIYRGKISNGVAVTLINLSPTEVSNGSEISVGLDLNNRWSRGTCQQGHSESG